MIYDSRYRRHSTSRGFIVTIYDTHHGGGKADSKDFVLDTPIKPLGYSDCCKEAQNAPQIPMQNKPSEPPFQTWIRAEAKSQVSSFCISTLEETQLLLLLFGVLLF